MLRVCDAAPAKSRFRAPTQSLVYALSFWHTAPDFHLAYDGSQFGVGVINRTHKGSRSFVAACCLIAVALLYAPLGAATLSAYTSSCCSSGQCPIRGPHQHHAPATSEHAMDCGHEMPGMASCSMSCCHNPDHPALTPAIFVLPAPVSISVSLSIVSVAPVSAASGSSLSPEPLSPPPRFNLAAA